MSAGFNSPSILFLSTWDQPERHYMGGLLTKLKDHGYTKLVEPCVGAFVMPTIALSAGWPIAQLDTSDTPLFSALMGAAFAHGSLDTLNLAIDGTPFVPTRPYIVEQVAEVMVAQLLLRLEQRPPQQYWLEMRRDLQDRREQHVDTITAHLHRLATPLRGLRFRSLDVWTHLREALEDPHTAIVSNPPTYKGGYEKFYDTGGRLTWDGPTYDVFDAKVDIYRMLDLAKDKPALMVVQQQQEPGRAAGSPVYARFLSPNQHVYLVTNRPDEVCGLMGGLKVSTGRGLELAKLDLPTIPQDYAITPDTRVDLMRVGLKEATYYRDLWMHKLDFKGAGAYVAVILDGQMAGLLGYDPGPILRPYSKKWMAAMLMTFAVGAPHVARLTRLITMLALNRPTMDVAVGAQLGAMAKKMITVELTRHPEIKGLRGLMKMDSRIADPKYGYRLVYVSDLTTDTAEEVVQSWLQKEATYRQGKMVVASR